jgi:hypothetical protein
VVVGGESEEAGRKKREKGCACKKQTREIERVLNRTRERGEKKTPTKKRKTRGRFSPTLFLLLTHKKERETPPLFSLWKV